MIEVARAHIVPRPWGVRNLQPWHQDDPSGRLIGEVCFERSTDDQPNPALLLKLLFTSEPLSIQVHPDDDHARALGLANGKTEAWYVLEAKPGATIALGLNETLSVEGLRDAAQDGSILNRVAWRGVSAADAIEVPAGTIHAIGAGLVIAEIQQRSDTTFRLFDYGRDRELHIEQAISVSIAGNVIPAKSPYDISAERTLLVANRHFVFERITLPRNGSWVLNAEHETWLLAIAGDARVDSSGIAAGHAIFAEDDRVSITSGANGVVCLVAYVSPEGPIPNLLQRASRDVPVRATPIRASGPSTQREV